MSTYLLQIMTTTYYIPKIISKSTVFKNIQNSKIKKFQKQKWLVTMNMKHNLLLF